MSETATQLVCPKCQKRHPPDWKHAGECSATGCNNAMGARKGAVFCDSCAYKAGLIGTPGDVAVAESASVPGRLYRVLVTPQGAACTCRGYETRGDCRHIQKVRGEMTEANTQALVPVEVSPPLTPLPTRAELAIIGAVARTVIKARGHAVPTAIDSEAKAAAVMLAGWELGVKPMTALRHIFVVNGKTEPDAQLMAGIIQAREPDTRFTIVELTDARCTMRLERPQRGLKVEYTYTYADAQAAGLPRKGGPWVEYKKDMLRWAATKRLARVYCPDLINNVSTVDVTDSSLLLAQSDEPEGEIVETDAIRHEDMYSAGDDESGAEEDITSGKQEPLI